MSEQPVHVKMLIGGQWTGGPNVIEVRNPAHPDEVVGTAIRGTETDVEHAIAAAKTAQPGWSSQSAPKYCQQRLIDLQRERTPEHAFMRARTAASLPRPSGNCEAFPWLTVLSWSSRRTSMPVIRRDRGASDTSLNTAHRSPQSLLIRRFRMIVYGRRCRRKSAQCYERQGVRLRP